MNAAPNSRRRKPIVAGYRRVSSEEQHLSGFSLQTQLDSIIEKADEMLGKDNYTFIDFCEPGLSGDYPPYSGMGSTAHTRRKLGELLKAVNLADIDYLVVKDLDRLSRNDTLSLQIRDVIIEAGVKLVSVDDNVDLETPLGLFVYVLKSGIAAHERRQIAKRIKDGVQGRIKDGYWTGIPGFGWTRQGKHNVPPGQRPNVVQVEEQARIVRIVYDWALAGWSDISILEELNQMGIVTQRGHSEWSLGSVKGILRSPIHAGLIKVGEDYVEAAHYDDRIVEPEEWRRIQAMRDKRKRIGATTRHSRNHLIAGFAKCGSCGQNVKLTTNAYGDKYYRCQGPYPRKPEICRGFTKRASHVEEPLLARLKELAMNEAIQESARASLDELLAEGRREVESKLLQAKKELGAIDAKREQLFAEFRRSELPPERIAEWELRFEKEKAELVRTQKELESEQMDVRQTEARLGHYREALKRFDTLWEVMTIEEQRQLIETIFESITLHREDASVILTLKPFFGPEERIVIPPGKSGSEGPGEADGSLTLRELAVLALLDEGLSKKDIASQMGIGLPAVENHILKASRKLQTHSMTETAVAARDEVARKREFLPLSGRSKSKPAGSEKLSALQLDILHEAADGLSPREIARRRERDLKTIRHHLQVACSKLGVEKTEEAISKARELGVI